MSGDGAGEPGGERGPMDEATEQRMLGFERQLARVLGLLEAFPTGGDNEGVRVEGAGGAAAERVGRVGAEPPATGGAAAARLALDEPTMGQAGGNPGSNEADYLQVRGLLSRAAAGYERNMPTSNIPGVYPLLADMVYEYLMQEHRRGPAAEEYIWMTCIGAHTAAARQAADELLPYVNPADSNVAPFLARLRNHLEAVDESFRFRVAFLRKWHELARTGQDKGPLEVLRSTYFQPSNEELGSSSFAQVLKVYDDKVVEASINSSAKALATARVNAALRGRGRGRGRGRDGDGGRGGRGGRGELDA